MQKQDRGGWGFLIYTFLFNFDLKVDSKIKRYKVGLNYSISYFYHWNK